MDQYTGFQDQADSEFVTGPNMASFSGAGEDIRHQPPAPRIQDAAAIIGAGGSQGHRALIGHFQPPFRSQAPVRMASTQNEALRGMHSIENSLQGNGMHSQLFHPDAGQGFAPSPSQHSSPFTGDGSLAHPFHISRSSPIPEVSVRPTATPASAFLRRFGTLAHLCEKQQTLTEGNTYRSAAKVYFYASAGRALWRSYDADTRYALSNGWDMDEAASHFLVEATDVLTAMRKRLHDVHGTDRSSKPMYYNQPSSPDAANVKEYLFDQLLAKAKDGYPATDHFGIPVEAQVAVEQVLTDPESLGVDAAYIMCLVRVLDPGSSLLIVSGSTMSGFAAILEKQLIEDGFVPSSQPTTRSARGRSLVPPWKQNIPPAAHDSSSGHREIQASPNQMNPQPAMGTDPGPSISVSTSQSAPVNLPPPPAPTIPIPAPAVIAPPPPVAYINGLGPVPQTRPITRAQAVQEYLSRFEKPVNPQLKVKESNAKQAADLANVTQNFDFWADTLYEAMRTAVPGTSRSQTTATNRLEKALAGCMPHISPAELGKRVTAQIVNVVIDLHTNGTELTTAEQVRITSRSDDETKPKDLAWNIQDRLGEIAYGLKHYKLMAADAVDDSRYVHRLAWAPTSSRAMKEMHGKSNDTKAQTKIDRDKQLNIPAGQRRGPRT
ncbi:uncharacterized protein RCC_09913 [Ramularia collo-cygni]|uniref:Uncharacterized protein n=1 Tax=Ramularia collo-cygni TaxID=112498 RepID=A0A2D3V487_9PEZI|nr:uncharacterized protein RCC_09913 [Ramularia collo-cygni]CZT24196.1 uncharacterized protein RCC_09913 [Ramularia collo-cygni]